MSFSLKADISNTSSCTYICMYWQLSCSYTFYTMHSWPCIQWIFMVLLWQKLNSCVKNAWSISWYCSSIFSLNSYKWNIHSVWIGHKKATLFIIEIGYIQLGIYTKQNTHFSLRSSCTLAKDLDSEYKSITKWYKCKSSLRLLDIYAAKSDPLAHFPR